MLPGGSPHQGGIVDLPNGESWFLGFKSTGHLGRVVHLLPVKWGEDGWPVFGDGGRTVDRWKKPSVGPSQPIARPATSDDFDGPGALPAVAVEPQPRAGGLVPRGAAGLAAPRGEARFRHVAGPEHAHPEAVGRRRRRRRPPRRERDGRRPAHGPHLHQRKRFRLGGRRHERGPATHPLGPGRGPGPHGGRGLAARTVLGRRSPGSSTASTVDPGPTPEPRSRSRSPTGRGRGSGSSATGDGDASTSTP